MVKRVASAVLWLFTVGWAFNFLSLATGLSPLIGGVVALGTALLVGFDPLRVVWAAPSDPAPVRDLAIAPNRVAGRI